METSTDTLAAARRDLALELFDQHRRNGLAVTLSEVPGRLDELKVGRAHPDFVVDQITLSRLRDLALCAGDLPTDVSLADHVEAGAVLSIVARLLAVWLPETSASVHPLGVVPLDAVDDPEHLFDLMSVFSTELEIAAAHLLQLASEAETEWVDPRLLAADVADIHDLAKGYATAARFLDNLHSAVMHLR